MIFTFYGHATFSIQVAGKTLMFDPFISGNAKAAHIDPTSLKADYVLLSHGHVDHVLDALTVASANNAPIVSNYEIVSWFGAQHEYANGHPMNHGGSWNFDFGKVKFVNAVHSSTLPDGNYGGNPGGFVVETGEGNFYYAGDTALTLDMKLIPMRTKLDFAILPIGDNFTMGIEDAITAAEFIECDKIIGVHFDTFPYIEIDHEAAKKAFADKGKELIILGIGEQTKL